MARRELSEKTSWDDGFSQVAYTADALAIAGTDGDKQVAVLGHRLEKVIAQWEALDAERRAQRRAVNRANALVRRRDVQADGVVTALHNDALAHTKQDREAPLFARLFPDALSVVVRMALESELPALRALALKLAESETPAALKKAHAAPLAKAIEQGEAAIRTREEAFATAGRTSARVASWREDANAVLLGVEGALKQLASERKLGSDWVEAFFPVADHPKKSKKAGGGDTPAPATPAK